MKTLPRREFLLQALAACGTAGVAAGRPTNAAAQSARADRGRSTSTGYFGDDVEAVRAIGEAYLRQLGLDVGAESIRAAARDTLGVIDKSRDQPAAIRALEREVRRDFERGRVVQIGGWVLSKTEAELCALSRGLVPVPGLRPPPL